MIIDVQLSRRGDELHDIAKAPKQTLEAHQLTEHAYYSMLTTVRKTGYGCKYKIQTALLQ